MNPDDKAGPGPSYSTNTFGKDTNTFGKDEVIQLLGEVLAQVKPVLHPPPLSQAALDAVIAYNDNRATLAHDGRPARTAR